MAGITIGRFNAPKEKEIILGIDLGTTNSLVAISENGKPIVLRDNDGTSMVPSVIYLDEKTGTPIVGLEARRHRITDARLTAYSVKRFMGRGRKDLDPETLTTLDTSLSTDENIIIRLGKKSYSAIELSAEILKRLKVIAEKNLKTTVSKAVVTVPAYFNDSQRSATRLAGKLAGLDVVRIVNEPTAAALAYGLDKKNNDLIAVYDLGGGTFDISLLKLHDGIFEVLATNGDTTLGGDDFDNAVAEFIGKQIPGGALDENVDLQWKATLIENAEQIKVALSEKPEVTRKISLNGKTHEVRVTRQDFDRAIKPWVERTLLITGDALKDANLQISDLGDVVMVGGSTRIPLVRKMVGDYFKCTLNTDVNPDEVVALGAAVQADILSGENQDLVLLDVVPLSLGIETYGGTFGKIIHRNTKIPAMAQETFTTHVDGQKNVLIHILQGERELATDCRSLGRFNLTGLPPMPAGLPKIQVTFLVDANGILRVTARELATETQAAIEVQPSYGLSDQKVEEILHASLENAEYDMRRRQLIDTRVEAEGILRSANKILNEGTGLKLETGVNEIKEKISKVRQKIKEDDYVAIRDALEELETAAKPLAAEVMNQALQHKLKTKNVNEVAKSKEEKS